MEEVGFYHSTHIAASEKWKLWRGEESPVLLLSIAEKEYYIKDEETVLCLKILKIQLVGIHLLFNFLKKCIYIT